MARGRKPGCQKTPGSGKKKGYVSKDTEEVYNKARELGCDPLRTLFLFAEGRWEDLGYDSPDKISPELRQKSAAESSQYLHPKRSAVAHTVDSESSGININISDSPSKKT